MDIKIDGEPRKVTVDLIDGSTVTGDMFQIDTPGFVALYEATCESLAGELQWCNLDTRTATLIPVARIAFVHLPQPFSQVRIK